MRQSTYIGYKIYFMYLSSMASRVRVWICLCRCRGPGFDSRALQKKSSGSGTGLTQPREYNWGATWWKSSGSCLENREYGRRDPSRWPRCTLYPQKLAITSPTSGGRSVGIVRSRTQTMKFSFSFFYLPICNVYKSIYNETPSFYRILRK
jgi:hypothetical protein